MFASQLTAHIGLLLVRLESKRKEATSEHIEAPFSERSKAKEQSPIGFSI
jgi:hypothetical protein